MHCQTTICSIEAADIPRDDFDVRTIHGDVLVARKVARVPEGRRQQGPALRFGGSGQHGEVEYEVAEQRRKTRAPRRSQPAGRLKAKRNRYMERKKSLGMLQACCGHQVSS
jgi:hypothetical protein